jgi:hypothetical protein
MSLLYVVAVLQLSATPDCSFSSFVVPAPGMGVNKQKATNPPSSSNRIATPCFYNIH